ncbi:hypothetical protein ACFV98_35930 [Streptomyces violascens]|uniref:hypothetical protein n=1 Tax=Streptomyces violascens TaxID=67381 RepID=UPI003665CC1C
MKWPSTACCTARNPTPSPEPDVRARPRPSRVDEGSGAGATAQSPHVEGYGWLGSVSGNPVHVGTTGQPRRMEAVRVWA